MAVGTVVPLYREHIGCNGASYAAPQTDDYYTSSTLTSQPSNNNRGIDTTAYSTPQYDYRSWIDRVRLGYKTV